MEHFDPGLGPRSPKGMFTFYSDSPLSKYVTPSNKSGEALLLSAPVNEGLPAWESTGRPAII